MMATGVPPPPKAPPGWHVQSSQQSETSGLEVGMAGMNLMGYSGTGSSRPPALSNSSLSDDASPKTNSYTFGNFDTSGDHSTGGSAHGSTPPQSPASPIHKIPLSNSYGNAKGMSLPSPIGKSSNNPNNTSASSPILSITPPSSIDANADIFSMAKQHNSPFFDAPAPPNLDQTIESSRQSHHRTIQSFGDPAASSLENQGMYPTKDHRRGPSFDSKDNQERLSSSFNAGIFSTGSYDPSDNDDGLKGLGALRERAQSSPGISMSQAPGSLSSSPVLYRESSASVGENMSGSLDEYASSRGGVPRHYRTNSRDGNMIANNSRPPLRGGGTSKNFSLSPDGSSVERATGIHQSSRNSHPDLRYNSDGVPETSRDQRAMQSINSGGNDHYQNQQPYIDQFHRQKFRAPQTLNSHLQHHRGSTHMLPSHAQQLQSQQQGMHVRSYSQPGPIMHGGYAVTNEDAMRYAQSQQQYRGEQHPFDRNSGQRVMYEGDTQGPDNLNFSQGPAGPQLSRSVSAGGMMSSRGGHQSQPSLSSAAVEGHSHHGSSFYSSQGERHHQMLPELPRNQSLDFHPGRQHRYDDGNIPVMASQEEMMQSVSHERDRRGASGFRQERAPYSERGSYGGRHPGHFRQYSDGGMQMNSGRPRGVVYQGHSVNHHRQPGMVVTGGHQQRNPSFDDDLAHPLVGEHIDDPGDDVDGDMHHSMGGGMTHSVQYITPQHHVITTSSSMEQISSSGMILPQYAVMETSQRHHMAASTRTAALAPREVFSVKFKRTQRSFILGPRVTRDLKIGCYVKVEADRGEDLGIVVNKISAEKFNMGRSRGPSASSGEIGVIQPTAGAVGPIAAADLKRIIRLATHDEVSLLAIKRQEEEELLNICRGKVRQRGLPMHVVDAEYQFDRHKLVFFFEADGRIDFRELVRDLFSMYKTRIWMQQLDKSGSGPVGIGYSGTGSTGGNTDHPNQDPPEVTEQIIADPSEYMPDSNATHQIITDNENSTDPVPSSQDTAEKAATSYHSSSEYCEKANTPSPNKDDARSEKATSSSTKEGNDEILEK